MVRDGVASLRYGARRERGECGKAIESGRRMVSWLEPVLNCFSAGIVEAGLFSVLSQALEGGEAGVARWARVCAQPPLFPRGSGDVLWNMVWLRGHGAGPLG